MSAYAPFDRPRVRKLRDDLSQALAEVGKRFGVTITLGAASFSPAICKFRLEVAGPTSNGEATSAVAEDFKRYAGLWGMQKDDLNKTFVFRGETYTLIGAKPRSSRFPLLGKRADGKVFKFTIADVTAQLTAAKPKRPEAVILKALQDVECALSPENLTCDGELPQSQVRAKARQLHQQRAALVAELGREPTDRELYGI